MINIKLLGSVSVSVDGTPIGGDAGQRRRLALLAVLAVPPVRSYSRDRLIGLLWPENETESARHLLSASIHVLRKALGSDALLSTGDDVSLKNEAVAIDALEFRNALSAGDFARAVELYGGPFLDGFYISGAPEFEQWIDGERAEYSALNRSALSGLAGQHERAGDAKAAAAVWRRLAVADPYNSRVAIGFMHALARVGERAAAIQHARVFAQLLEQEVGARPDPEVEALAESLRSQPAPAVPTRREAEKPTESARPSEPVAAAPQATPPAASSPAPVAARPRWPRSAAIAAILVIGVASGWFAIDRFRESATVAVLPMPTDSMGEHWSEIGEYILDRLAQVNRLHTVPSTSTQPLQMRKLDARTIAQRVNARYAISVQTGLARTRDSLRARIELVDARANALMWSRTYRFPLDSVLHAQNVIADDVIVAITGRSASSRREVPVTANPTAYDLYLQGTFQLGQRTPAALERARALFTQAIELDSTYAKAYTRLADAYNMLGSYDYGSLEPRSAYAQSRSAAARARLLDAELAGPHAALANVYVNFDWDFAAGEQEFKVALRLNPDCPECRQWLGLLYAATGRPAEAIAQADSAVAIDPASPLAFTTRAQVLYYAGDFETAAQSLESALEIQQDFNRAHVLLALVDYQRGRAGEALERLTSLLAIQEEPLLLGVLSYLHGRTGGRAQAERYYQRLQAVSAQRYVPAEYHALANIGMDRIDEAFNYLNEAAARHSGGMVYLNVEPMLKPIRSDPRFAELLRATRH